MKPQFSVIIATYNRANFLNRALDSLIQQTETDWEAWIIDDGSTDNTLEVLQKYLDNYPQIQYRKISKSGEAPAKNLGIALCKGKYITFLDSDDAYEPHHLAHRKSILDQHTNLQFLHGGIKIIGDPYVPDRNNPGLLIHVSSCVAGATFFIRRDAMAQLAGFKQLPLGNDADLYERAVQAQLTMMKTDFPTYIYFRNHDNSITHNAAKPNT
ncbi:MAG: glycosyltransferase family 2 protein [Chitinophagales bacterium]|nr:glycosyltransferase family 2 protein [Chitinophagales bacterium]